MNTVAASLDPALTELAEFAGMQLRIAIDHLSKRGFSLTALGTTVTAGWWNGTSYKTHVLQTDDPKFIEQMSMNWLMSDHKKSKFVGIVMDGAIAVEGNKTEALILRSRTANSSIKMMAYQPYKRATEHSPSSLLNTIVDFPAELALQPEAREIVLAIMLRALIGKAS
jgi:hypothetical protein